MRDRTKQKERQRRNRKLRHKALTISGLPDTTASIALKKVTKADMAKGARCNQCHNWSDVGKQCKVFNKPFENCGAYIDKKDTLAIRRLDFAIKKYASLHEVALPPDTEGNL